MSLLKYRIREVAADFNVPAKDIAEILTEYDEKPKSNTQVLEDHQLNLIFDYMTQKHPIESVEQVFAVVAAQTAPAAPKPQTPAQQPAPAAATSAQTTPAPAPQTAKPQGFTPRPQQPGQSPNPAAGQANNTRPEQRRRERRVVDTSAVTVNAERFDDRVDSLVSERVQNYSGGKQKIGNKAKKQQQKGKFGTKVRSEEQEKMRRLQLEIAKKTPLTVKIPDEITVSELALRMKKTAAEVIKHLIKMGVMAAVNQNHRL